MTVLRVCWSPCWCHSTVKQGSAAVAIYTIVLNILSLVYISWVMRGGQSSDLYSPFFEADIDETMGVAGGITITFCCLYLIAGAVLLVGIANDIRGMMLPYLFLNGVVCLVALAMGIFMIARYYIYPLAMLSSVFMWLFFCIQVYCQLCVMSQYQLLMKYQTANIEVMYN